MMPPPPSFLNTPLFSTDLQDSLVFNSCFLCIREVVLGHHQLRLRLLQPAVHGVDDVHGFENQGLHQSDNTVTFMMKENSEMENL